MKTFAAASPCMSPIFRAAQRMLTASAFIPPTLARVGRFDPRAAAPRRRYGAPQAAHLVRQTGICCCAAAPTARFGLRLADQRIAGSSNIR